MKKIIVIVAGILLIAGGALLYLAPDTLSMLILIIMCAILALGFFMGLLPMLQFRYAFKTARKNIEESVFVQSAETWIAVFKLESLFRQKELDRIFKAYKAKIEEQKENGEIESDIEEYINENTISLRSWQGFVAQIPGILTGIGILGTFIGLISGISSVGFSSVDAAIESVSTLLAGIRVAFFTSICGVILSIIFNILNRITWNTMMREHGLFVEIFHRDVIASVEEQSRSQHRREVKTIINRLDRLPKNFVDSERGEFSHAANEQLLMPQIIEGLKNGEFTFYLQPKLELNSSKIVGVEALARWKHENLGVLTPASFFPLLEKNGYITKLDAYIWEEVFMTVRRWIDAGLRPVPISVNVSKTAILAMDVSGFFARMLNVYNIPPRLLEIEITKDAYIQSSDAVCETAAALRRMGFKVIMDDFDGDYISVNMMNGMETDAFKLDLRLLPEREYNSVEAIFERARKLNIEMMVEGIENPEQIASLNRIGSFTGQGYYYYKPMTIEEYEELTADA